MLAAPGSLHGRLRGTRHSLFFRPVPTPRSRREGEGVRGRRVTRPELGWTRLQTAPAVLRSPRLRGPGRSGGPGLPVPRGLGPRASRLRGSEAAERPPRLYV